MKKALLRLLSIFIVTSIIVGFFTFVGFCSYIDTKYPYFWDYFGVGFFMVICVLLILWMSKGIYRSLIRRYYK